MNSGSLLFVYCVLIMTASVLGGQLPKIVRMTHLRTQLLMSSVGGLMLGIALLHLIPHASDLLASPSRMGHGVLIGLISMFLLIRLFHTHDHGVPVEADSDVTSCCHHHEHEPDHAHVHHAKGISWAGLFVGLALHTMVDGVALASSVIAEPAHSVWLGLAGLGTFLAVALHKPLDAFAITSVMNKQKWSSSAQASANIAFSLACPLGAGLFFLGANMLADNSQWLGWGLAISAGFFIGIALADLLPEVAFHDHDRLKLTIALFVGIAIAVGVESLPGHSHPPHDQTVGVSQ